MSAPHKEGFWGWYMQRLTGLLLTLGLFVHFIVLHFFIERPVDFNKVSDRLHSPTWIIFDLILLSGAIYHGLYGVYGMVLDMDPGPQARRSLGWTFWSIGAATFIIGAAILNPFAT